MLSISFFPSLENILLLKERYRRKNSLIVIALTTIQAPSSCHKGQPIAAMAGLIVIEYMTGILSHYHDIRKKNHETVCLNTKHWGKTYASLATLIKT